MLFRLLSKALLILILPFIFLACEEESDDEPIINTVVNTVRDTIIQRDSTILRDTIVKTDTISQTDTLFLRDTLFIRDKTKIISTDITSNTRWFKDTVYIVVRKVLVQAQSTLTIDPGTVVKFALGQESNANMLFVVRGGRLIADGTAQEPIIFTSTVDEIAPGQIKSPNLPSDLQGLWGGLALLGNARVSTNISDPNGGGFDIGLAESFSSSDPNGIYGGSNDADNSGTLRYVSIRHAGTNLGNGDEANSLGLFGVGNSTIISNIETVAGSDDGIALHGGTVRVDNFISYNAGDDAIDPDEAYSGLIDNFVIFGAEGHPLELDGPEGAYMNGNFTLRNGTVVCERPNAQASQSLSNYDDNTNGTLQNIHFTSVVSGQVFNDKSIASPIFMSFSNITIDVPAGFVLSDFVDSADMNVVAATSAGTTGLANTAVFNAWTLSDADGILGGL